MIPNILIVKPSARLSWKHHDRHTEIWQVYKCSAGIIRSNLDKENEIKVYNDGLASWYDFVCAVIELGKVNCKVKPIETKKAETI